jgi:hypothetical protein
MDRVKGKVAIVTGAAGSLALFLGIFIDSFMDLNYIGNVAP